MSKELVKADSQTQPAFSPRELGERVTLLELEINQHGQDALTFGFKGVAKMFEQGDNLLLAKQNLKHGEFLPWLAQWFTKSEDTAQKYMRMAATVPNNERARYLMDAKSQRAAFELAGILAPIPTKAIANGEDVTIPPWLQKLTWLAEWYGKNPVVIEEMEPIAREELKAKLNPIVEIYEKL
jgi:hypothetical protein